MISGLARVALVLGCVLAIVTLLGMVALVAWCLAGLGVRNPVAIGGLALLTYLVCVGVRELLGEMRGGRERAS